VSRLVVGQGRWHTYSLDGQRVPSVTSILGKATAKDGLAFAAAKEVALWAAGNLASVDVLGQDSWVNEAKGAPRRAWDAAAQAGTQVHSIAERLIYGEPVDTADPGTGEAYSPDVVAMGEQVARFMDVWDVSPDTALVELPVFHEDLHYAGKFDLCGILQDHQRWLIDYKTGQSGVWAESALQLTGYSRATHVQIGDRDMLMPPVDRCAVLWVRPDFWQLIPVKSDQDTWQAFRAAKVVSDWFSQPKDELVGAALPVPGEAA
jgi:hypothetical protein